MSGIKIEVTTDYVSEQSVPEQERYVFSYTITIRNEGNSPAKLVSRHWFVTDADGNVQEVRGEGVVGQQPHLRPGEGFQYTSGTMLKTPVGSMHGNYFMVDDLGQEFSVDIPAFRLSVPRVIH